MDGSYLLEKGSRMEKELYKIAICDDDIRICTELEKSILEYARYNHKLLSVEPYYGEQKLCHWHHTHFIFLNFYFFFQKQSPLFCN